MNSILICSESGYEHSYRKGEIETTFNLSFSFVNDPSLVTSKVLNGNYDLLILDIDIYGLNALAIIRRIRESLSATELPILIAADKHLPNKCNTILDAGANDLLSKPIDTEELSFRIKNNLFIRTCQQENQTLQQNLARQVKERTEKLNMLINSGLMMSMEKNRSKLLTHILSEGKRLLNCDGGTMYLVTEHHSLKFAERTRKDVLPYDEIPFFDPNTGAANEGFVSVFSALHKIPIIIDDIYKDSRFDWSGTRQFDAQSGYRTVSLLTVPMAPRKGKVIGILQFINALDPNSGEIVPFSSEFIDFVEALAAQAAVALDNLQLVEAQKATTENIIKILAAALDTKSPHTGYHCVRVPQLALMLADVCCKETSGPLADFNFNSEDEWFEFRVGAWLHDCGKVTTPEYVIEKATKLEMLYNRIHEIRMRFEVLLRDAEINRLNALFEGASESEANAVFDQQKKELMSDFEFIAECNLGTEKMDPAHIDRINTIAQKTWMRNFDDRLGLSKEELLRQQSKPSLSLPVKENLLYDKFHHIIPRRSNEIPAHDLNIKMDIPQNLYNHGEIYNLSVPKGTLTPEERYKINEHIIETIKMLEKMPFPDSLKRVPEYATTHHEKLDGSGYPRRLKSSELSIPARIMAIADIFEALTSSERPYKEPYKLSESIKILHQMKRNHQIDPDLFALFLTSGVFRKYAEFYLQPEQIDEVNINDFLDPTIS